jgi:hypothetical protein
MRTFVLINCNSFFVICDVVQQHSPKDPIINRLKINICFVFFIIEEPIWEHAARDVDLYAYFLLLNCSLNCLYKLLIYMRVL